MIVSTVRCAARSDEARREDVSPAVTHLRYPVTKRG
jgi:hypothetical protein